MVTFDQPHTGSVDGPGEVVRDVHVQVPEALTLQSLQSVGEEGGTLLKSTIISLVFSYIELTGFSIDWIVISGLQISSSFNVGQNKHQRSGSVALHTLWFLCC